MVQERARLIPWPVRGSYVSATASLDHIDLVVGQTSKTWGSGEDRREFIKSGRDDGIPSPVATLVAADDACLC